MKSLPMTLLKNREEFWSRVEAQDLRWSELPSLIVFIGLACALYGTVLAGWRSPRLALYVAAKLPLDQRVGQLYMMAISQTSPGSQTSLVGTAKVGSVLLLAAVPVAYLKKRRRESAEA